MVITIIVLLILVAVSLRLISGNEGILERAETAVNKNSVAELKEEAILALTGRIIDKYDVGMNQSLKEVLEEGITGEKVIEEVTSDICYVTKGDAVITVYEDGTVEIGKVDVWDGSAKTQPTIDENNNWHIHTTAELKYLADFVNGELAEAEKGDLQITADTIVYLENDLDLGARQQNGTKTHGENWIPIGKSSDTKFLGTFDGNNHIVRGLYVDKTENFSGFFGNANTVRNLTIKDSYVLGGNATGSIAGLIRGTIENCHNVNSTVMMREGEYRTCGGIVGQGKTVLKCTNSGKIMGEGVSSGESSQTGGIVGILPTSGTMKECENTGTVSGHGNYVGGVVGYMSSSAQLMKSSNSGKVEGKSRAGGITGSAGNSTNILECVNTGNVLANGMFVGGIVGILGGNVEKCYNSGEIKQKQSDGDAGIGGICGETYMDSTIGIKNCYNKGKIIEEASGTAEKPLNGVGGIIGYISATNSSGVISNNYNFGQIEILGENIINIGSVIGRVTSDAFVRNNNYYLEGTPENAEGEKKSATEMKKQEFVDLLNTGLEEIAWEIRDSENEGYPVIIGVE